MNLNVNAYTKQIKKFPKKAIKQTRVAADASADVVLDSKKVVRKAEKATLSFNNIAYGTANKLVGKRFDMIEKTLDASAKRLKKSAKAKSVKALIETHADLNNATVARLTKDFNETVAILVDAKNDLVELFDATYSTKPANKKAKKTIKAVKKTAKKAKRKAAAKAKPAKKATRKVAKKTAKKVAKKTKPVKRRAKKVAKKVAKKTTRKTTRKTTARRRRAA